MGKKTQEEITKNEQGVRGRHSEEEKDNLHLPTRQVAGDAITASTF